MIECRACHKALPESEFYVNKVRGWRFPSCKACTSQAINDKKKRRRYWLARHKTASGCAVCGFNKHASALDWHHRDPGAKEYSITRVIDGSPLRKLFAELRKCVVLCANCHRMHHAGVIDV